MINGRDDFEEASVQTVRSALRRLETLPYRFTREFPKNTDLVVTTGADSSHFLSLKQFLYSLRRHEPKVRSPTDGVDRALAAVRPATEKPST